MNKLSFEISTQIGGSIQSLKNCTQELMPARYKENRNLSPEVYRQSVDTIQAGIRTRQTGFIEPFGGIDVPACNYYKGGDSCG
jgi:hypothetical protein